MTRCYIELPYVLLRIGYQGISILINDSVITPEPFMSLPSEDCRKSRVCGYYAVVGIAVTICFTDNRAALDT